jgi:hypothetical protein
MTIRTLLLASVAIATISAPAVAQVAAELEGRVTDITTTGTGPETTVTSLKVFNTTISIKPGTTFATPTRDGMSANNIGICNNRPFAGMSRTTKTMIGGTGIIVGSSVDLPAPAVGSVVEPQTVFLEPAENVLLGRITKIPEYELDPVTSTKKYVTGTLEVEGTSVVILGTKAGEHFPPTGTVAHNPCLPGTGVKNDFGFAIPPESLVVGAEAAAEGWFGDDGKFYAFLIESVGAPGIQPTSVSITRAQCRTRSATQMEWEIRGGTADEASGGAGQILLGKPVPSPTPENPNRTVFGAYTGATTTATADPLNRPYGLYTFKANINNQGSCPETVMVRYVGKSATVTVRAGVDRR